MTAASDTTRPRIAFLALGGTIASMANGVDAGSSPVLLADDIARTVQGFVDDVDLVSEQFMQIASPSLRFEDVLRLVTHARRLVADGATGIVVSQGTDTIEETSFAFDLLWTEDAPVVFTGAMRSPSLPGPDGPANLLAAIRVAAGAQFRGLGVLVVSNDEIHTSRLVRKTHISSLATFQSDLSGPIGWVSEGVPQLAVRPLGRATIDVADDASIPPVALVRMSLGDDGRIFDALPEHGYRGVVLEGFGGGHVAAPAVAHVRALAQRMPIVLASRTASGEVLRQTYRYPGSEIELLELGLIHSGALGGLKARVVLTMALAAGLEGEALVMAFDRIRDAAPAPATIGLAP